MSYRQTRTVPAILGVLLAAAAGCRMVEGMGTAREMPLAGPDEPGPGELPVAVLENEGVSVAVVPELGAKIVSIRDRRSGREWLWQNPHVPLRAAAPDADYGDYDLSGWDECFPSVGNVVIPDGPWAGRSTGDHGEIWCRPADVTFGAGRMIARMRGARFPYELRREIVLADGLDDSRIIRIEYELQVHGDAALPALWAAHALFALEPGMRIEFPPGTTFRVRSHDCRLGAYDTVFPWPVAPGSGEPVDLSVVEDPHAGWHAKLFTEFLPEPWARLHAPGGGDLTLEFPDTPHIGLWINYGSIGGKGQPPHANLGVEPTSSPAEHPIEARERGLPAEFSGVARWSVTVRIN